MKRLKMWNEHAKPERSCPANLLKDQLHHQLDQLDVGFQNVSRKKLHICAIQSSSNNMPCFNNDNCLPPIQVLMHSLVLAPYLKLFEIQSSADVNFEQSSQTPSSSQLQKSPLTQSEGFSQYWLPKSLFNFNVVVQKVVNYLNGAVNQNRNATQLLFSHGINKDRCAVHVLAGTTLIISNNILFMDSAYGGVNSSSFLALCDLTGAVQCNPCLHFF